MLIKLTIFLITITTFFIQLKHFLLKSPDFLLKSLNFILKSYGAALSHFMFLLVRSSDASRLALLVGCKLLSSDATLVVGGRPSAAFIFNHTSCSCLCCRRMQLLSSVAKSCRRVQLLSSGGRPSAAFIFNHTSRSCLCCRRMQLLSSGVSFFILIVIV